MKKYAFVFFLLFMYSLSNNNCFAIIDYMPILHAIPKDTTIVYFIEDVSSEGAEAEVRYIDGKISSAKIVICGDMGQTHLEYTFHKDNIKVIEKSFSYTKLL